MEMEAGDNSEGTEIVALPSAELIQASEVPRLLQQIRPQWQAKDLINWVRKLLSVDPGSACQRLFNAAIHDLREKVTLAGMDIAREAAIQAKLPPIASEEDVERYSTSNIIDLCYRMGLLSRPEWRRISRCYEIRRDLEHEDNEYEAGAEDCVYIFKTCIEVILAKDPIQLLRISDIKELIDQPRAAIPSKTLLLDYEKAPQPRQEEILKLLISHALDSEKSEIIQQNAFTFLRSLEPLTQNTVRLRIAEFVQQRIGRKGMDYRHARVALGAGVFPYLKKASREDFFEQQVYAQMKKVGSHWLGHTEHGELLRSLIEVGGLTNCPESIRPKIVRWLVDTYLGEPGGRTSYGNVRHVFFSDTAAPLIERIVSSGGENLSDEIKGLKKERSFSSKLNDQHIARRFEKLLDFSSK